MGEATPVLEAIKMNKVTTPVAATSMAKSLESRLRRSVNPLKPISTVITAVPMGAMGDSCTTVSWFNRIVWHEQPHNC